MTLDNHQPFYFYLDDDAVKTLAIRVTLRKVESTVILTTSSKVEGSEAAILQTIGWQEKVPGPLEITSSHRGASYDELSSAESVGKPP